MSDKRLARRAETAPKRQALIDRVGRCEVCGRRKGVMLAVHEIARGPDRNAALDKPFACLVVCWKRLDWTESCHDAIHRKPDRWPEARQLAVLKESRPEDFDLAAYCALRGLAPTHLTLQEVEQWKAANCL